MPWNVLITARTLEVVGESALRLLRDAGCQLTTRFGPLKGPDLIQALKGIDAVVATSDQYSAEALESAETTQLKIISRWGVGYDSVDVPAATRQGVAVAYTPGLLNEAVADYTFALLLAVARRVHEVHQSMANARWQVAWGYDIAGKTLGLIGCGRIGQAVARRAAGFNLRLLGHDVAPTAEARQLGIEFVTLDDLLTQSDFVTLHAALTPQSRGLIGEPQLRRMKPTAHLVNTGRGPLLDEAALARALREGWIAGAALDVYSTEPLPEQHLLRGAPNLLLSPHQSSFARETGERVSLAAAQAIVDLMNGRRPAMLVNPEVLNSPQSRARLV